MENLLEVKNLTKHFKEFSLNNVSFCVPNGSIVGFVGENGAGKTTVIKLILNMLHRDGGTIHFCGKDNREDEKAVRSAIGVVFDECCFHPDLRTRQLSRILSGIYPDWDEGRFTALCRQFSLPESKAFKTYSRGMKMKLQIAAALAHHPRLLLLDEATSGLDPIVRNEILDLLLEFIQDESRAVLFSTHITGDLEHVADYIAFLHAGRLVFEKSKDELIYQYGIVKCTSADLGKIEERDRIKVRKTAAGCEILVADKEAMRRKYPSMVVDSADIESVMLLYAARNSGPAEGRAKSLEGGVVI